MYRYIIFTFLGAMLISASYAQNGWTRGKDGVYAQATLAHTGSNRFFNPAGELQDNGNSFLSTSIFLYGEYGLTDRLDATLNLPFLTFNRFSNTTVAAGVGNARLGIKYGLLKKIPVSLQVELDIPTGDGMNLARTREPNSLGIFEQLNLPTSDGEFNVWTTLATSLASPKGKTFGSIYGSFNYRTQGFQHQILLGGELGQKINDKLLLIGKVRAQTRMPGQESGNGTGSFLYGEGSTFTAYSVLAMYKITEKVLLLGEYSDFAGFLSPRRNLYDSPGFSVGVAITY